MNTITKARRTFGKSTAVKAPVAETPVVLVPPAPLVAPAPEPEKEPNVQLSPLELAEKLAAKESPLMATTQVAIAKGREDWQGGPIMSLYALQQTYSDEELDAMPIVGTGTKERPSNNPDHFKMEYMEGDTRKTRMTTFYVQFVYKSPSGKNYLQRIEWCNRVADKSAVKDGIPEDILNMTPEQRRVHVTFCEGRLRTAAASYRNALKLHQQIKAVEAYGDGETVQVNPLWVEGHGPGEVEPEKVMLEPGNEPLYVSYHVEGKPTLWEMYSVTAFNKLKPAKAESEGGGWVKLRDSGATKKPPKAPGTVTKVDDNHRLKSPDASIGSLIELHRYFQDDLLSDPKQVEYGKLVQLLTAKDNDEQIVAIVELKNLLNDLCRDNSLDAKYTKLKQKGSDLIEQKAAASK